MRVASGQGDIADTAGSDATLIAASTKADHGDELERAGPSTVFAPGDQARAAASRFFGVTAGQLLVRDGLADILSMVWRIS